MTDKKRSIDILKTRNLVIYTFNNIEVESIILHNEKTKESQGVG